mgnify:CR=1 FL=1
MLLLGLWATRSEVTAEAPLISTISQFSDRVLHDFPAVGPFQTEFATDRNEVQQNSGKMEPTCEWSTHRTVNSEWAETTLRVRA